MRNNSSDIAQQTWAALSFTSWPANAAAIGRLLPDPLIPDTFNGSAWVSIVAFSVQNAALTRVPSFGIASSFNEINVRTYARYRDQPGIFMLSLDISNPLPVLAARAVTGLPLYWADVRIRDRGQGADRRVAYECRRMYRGRPRHCSLTVACGADPVDAGPGTLAEFLTRCYTLFAKGPAGMMSCTVRHRPLPLYEVAAVELQQDLLAAAGVTIIDAPPVVYYSPGCNVLVEPPQPAGGEAAGTCRR